MTRFNYRHWTPYELYLAELCRLNGLSLTKTWKDGYYTIYDTLYWEGATAANELWWGRDLTIPFPND